MHTPVYTDIHQYAPNILPKFFTIFNIRDRLQTTINVMGDTVAAAVVAKYSRNDFPYRIPGENVNSGEILENFPKGILRETEETNL